LAERKPFDCAGKDGGRGGGRRSWQNAKTLCGCGITRERRTEEDAVIMA